MESTRPRVVVGIDGSEPSMVALRAARREADLHEAELEVVLAWDYLDQPHSGGEAHFEAEYTEERAQMFLHEMVNTALGADPGPPVVETAVCDRPARALLEAGKGAALLVVGARGLGGFSRLRLGSVSQQVVTHAEGPVMVVPADAEQHDRDEAGPVVVGIDGSEQSRRALRWAVDEATRRQTSVLAVHAWEQQITSSGPFFTMPIDLDAWEASARRLVDEEMAELAKDRSVDRVEARLVAGSPAEVLIEAAGSAALAVVGSRGRGGFLGLLMGSVSLQLVHHAAAPVVVVPSE